jgi:hypothetical protein
LLFPMALAMSACASVLTALAPPKTKVVDYCTLAFPIAYDSQHDTPETVAAVVKHDSRYVCACEGDCPTLP